MEFGSLGFALPGVKLTNYRIKCVVYCSLLYLCKKCMQYICYGRRALHTEGIAVCSTVHMHSRSLAAPIHDLNFSRGVIDSQLISKPKHILYNASDVERRRISSLGF